MKQWFVVFTALSLLLLIISPACGGGEEVSTTAPTPTATTTTTLTLTLSPTPTPTPIPSNGPVKIGAIAPWSGPMAMTGMLADPIISLVEKQVKDMGGILGGREVKVIKYDSRGSVAEAVAGATKLLKEDKVAALVFGGASGADMEAVCAFAEDSHILYIPYGGVENMAEKKYTVTGTHTYDGYSKAIIDLAEKVIKPKTVAFLASDLWDSRYIIGLCKDRIKSTSFDVVYEQYSPIDTADFTPYLTKIKYTNPDLLITYYQPSEPYLAMAKQIMELDGWGNIKVIAAGGAESSVKLPGAQGWYVFVLWFPGLPYPGSIKFEQDYEALYGKVPTAVSMYYYNPLWTAIHAINLAGTDTDLEKIAQVTRSGDFEWETPLGRAHYTPDGDSGLHPSAAYVKDKILVPVTELQ